MDDAFNYLFSPFNPDGSRDNQKGLGKEWEKYNNYVGNAVKEGTILSFKEWIKKEELIENSPAIDVKSEP